MQRKGLFFVFIILFAISGCHTPGIPKEIAMERVKKAREELDTAKTTLKDINKVYPKLYEKAEVSLDMAENYLEKGQTDEAVEAANKSLQAKQEILKQYYVHRMMTRLGEAEKLVEEKTKIEGKDVTDEDDPLVQEKLTIQKEKIEQDKMNISMIMQDLKNTALMIERVKAHMKIKLDSDISFERGYELSLLGKQILDKFQEEVFKKQGEYIRQHPDNSIVIKVKSVGYADLLEVRRKSLINALTERKSCDDPDPAERKKCLNQLLSERRTSVPLSGRQNFGNN